MKILFVEDEKLLADALGHLFEENGFTSFVCYRGDDGLKKALEEDFDVIVLDIMLPGIDGFEFIKELRKHKNVPVLMLTAKDSLRDKVDGLNLGADDYLVKPFESDELIARVGALTRRARPTGGTDLEINSETLELIVGDRHIELTKKEEELLRYLLKSQGHPRSKGRILSEVWKGQSGISENSVELYIHYLRNKLKGSGYRIRTIRNKGYLLAKE